MITPTTNYALETYVEQDDINVPNSQFDGRYVLVIDQRRDSIPIYEPPNGIDLSERKISLFPSQRAINVACSLLIAAFSIAMIFAALPAAILLAIKLSIVAIGLLTCVNNNFRM